MLRSINALKLLLAAQNIIDYVNNNGFNDFDEASQQEFDVCHSLLADTVKLTGTSVSNYALKQVLQNCNLFNEQDISLVRDFIDEEEALEKEI